MPAPFHFRHVVEKVNLRIDVSNHNESATFSIPKIRPHNQILALLLLYLLFSVAGPAEATDKPKIEFNRDVRPILSQNCFYCHGNDEAHREADLRLDTFEGATETDAVVPNKSSASELIRRICSDDPDEIMPPPDSEKKLSPREIEILKTWIDQGAAFQEHWAWSPFSPGSIPEGLTSAQKIDFFLKENWEQNGITPVNAATPRELLRRLSFDLRGLPPTSKEVEEFAANPTDEHFLRIRDQWMTELSHAEHQAVRWLDLVRWADTSGFVSDEPIASGAYRRWVIQSIAENVPFDEFSIAQLAGDLLEYPSDDDLVASGYNRIVNTNCEAGAIESEQLYKLKGEHVRAFGTVWLGLTTGCAKCHDHKFDPITAKDYYSLAAFWDDLVEAGVYTPGDRREPLHYVHSTVKSRRQDQDLENRITKLKALLAKNSVEDLQGKQKELRERLKRQQANQEFTWILSDLPAMRVLDGEFTWVDEEDIPSFDTEEWQNSGKNKSHRRLRRTEARTNQLAFHHAAELMTGTVNESSLPKDKTKWFIEVWQDPSALPSVIGIQVSHGDYGRLGWREENYATYYWGTQDPTILLENLPWSQQKRLKHMGPIPSGKGWTRLEVPFDQLIPGAGGQNFEAVGMAWLHVGGSVTWGASGLQAPEKNCQQLRVAEFAMRKWWDSPINRQTYERREQVANKVITQPVDKLNENEVELLEEIYCQLSQPDVLEELRRLESELWTLRARAMPVLVSRSLAQEKTTRLLNRGDYQDSTGPIVSPAVPEFLGTLAENSDRLALARWLFEDASELTSRVYVNRLWHQFYGVGLSKTLGDVGTQGDWPSNIRLLDWLAREFRDSGWDRAHMIRLMTSTTAYKLSSRASPLLQEQDPENRLHARQSRFRLPAESIRDSALLASGLLMPTEEIPVQSFFPYQPEVYWKSSDKVMFGSRHMHWDTSSGNQQHHRSLYTFWKRQNIHPTMLAFDAPTRQECTAKRNITNTPGQALALLNDPIFVEAAKGLAIEILKREGSAKRDSEEAAIEVAFRLTLQRNPSMEETKVLLNLLRHARSTYTESTSQAALLNQVGQNLDGQQNIPPVELAAWTTVTRAILNLHEFLVRP